MGKVSAGVAALICLTLVGCSRQEDPTDVPQPQTRSQLPEGNAFGTQVRALEQAERVERTLDAAAHRQRESLDRQERP